MGSSLECMTEPDPGAKQSTSPTTVGMHLHPPTVQADWEGRFAKARLWGSWNTVSSRVSELGVETKPIIYLEGFLRVKVSHREFVDCMAVTPIDTGI